MWPLRISLLHSFVPFHKFRCWDESTNIGWSWISLFLMHSPHSFLVEIEVDTFVTKDQRFQVDKTFLESSTMYFLFFVFDVVLESSEFWNRRPSDWRFSHPMLGQTYKTRRRHPDYWNWGSRAWEQIRVQIGRTWHGKFSYSASCIYNLRMSRNI